MIKTIALGLLSFTTTNFDNFLLLLLLFSNKTIPTRTVLLGQYLGMLGILFLSYCVGSAGSFFLPARWIGVLGIVPLLIGLTQLVQGAQLNSRRGASPGDSRSGLAKFSKIGVFTITMMTIANGGDNIAVYSGIFSVRSRFDILLLLGTYIILTAIWCIAGFSISSHKKWGKTIKHLNITVFPFAMIAMGLLILLKLV